MYMDCYNFNGKLSEGEQHEADLDRYYSQWFDIQSVSMNAQRSGIDRVWTRKSTNVSYSMEYKSDTKAASTGNAFIETVSVDAAGKPGWAYTSCAQLLAYYVPPLNRVYHLTMMAIKNNVDKWAKMYPPGKAKNDGYYTHGVLVPLSEFQKHAYRIIEINTRQP